MTDPPLSTMAPPKAAAPSRAQQHASTTPQSTLNNLVIKSSVTREYEITLRAFFPTPSEPTKFNPIPTMTQLLRTMLKDESSLVLCTPDNDKQIILATMQLPTSKSEFQKFFNVSTTRILNKNQSNVCIGCTLLSNRSLSKIKFNSPNNHLLAWLKQARVFVEADSLGTKRPTTIGYITRIATDITHLTNFRDHLASQLMMIEIDADTVISLAPHLYQAQLDVMSNGDEFVPILPNFKLYRMHISHGSEPNKISTDVLGIKTAPKDSKLLGEFFTRFATENSNDQRDGVFLPRGAATILGPTTYTQVLKDNNFFLTQVVTIPVNLEHNAWFALIDPNSTSEDKPLTIHDHLMRQPWFLRIKLVARKKCLLVTNKSNLLDARAWIDANLEPLVRKSLPPGIDPPSSVLPCCLDKPVHTVVGQTYANILKKQFSLAPDLTMTATTNMRPPRKRQATIIDYDSDQSTETVKNDTTHDHSTRTMTPTNTTNNTTDYAKELLSLKADIESLRTTITTAVAQMKEAIKVLLDTPRKPESNAMDAEAETPSDTATQHQTQLDLPSLIADLKNEIATIVTKTRALFHQQSLTVLHSNHLPSKT